MGFGFRRRPKLHSLNIRTPQPALPLSIEYIQSIPRGSIAVPFYFLGLPYRVLNINHKKELLWSLWLWRNQTGTQTQSLGWDISSFFFGGGVLKEGNHGHPNHDMAVVPAWCRANPEPFQVARPTSSVGSWDPRMVPKALEGP